MKRSQKVNTDHLRKDWRWFAVAPVAAAVITGCDSGPQTSEANIYRTIDDCINNNPALASECRAAYQDALLEAERTAPRYDDLQDCYADFGQNACVKSPSNNWFLPAMGGFMLAKMLDSRSYYSQPMYYSSSPSSRYYDVWTTTDGYSYGSTRSNRPITVTRDEMKKKPAVTRTIQRGGFGSTAQAKSSWSGSSSKTTASSSSSKKSSSSSFRSSSSRSSGWGG